MGDKKNNEFGYCCELIEKFVDDPRIGINYNKKLREYSIDLFSGSAAQDIYHCPFCSAKLPTGLRDEYCDILKREFDINSPFRPEVENNLSKEFKSDEWWKKRNL
jgi:hypothetical protein